MNMNTESRQKYFVNQKEAVAIRCHSCGRTQSVAVANHKGAKHSVTIHCPCTKTFEADLEFRQDYRKKTLIPCSVRPLTTPKARARQCIIADTSSGGLLLWMAEDVPLKQDDRLIVSYRPDNGSAEEIERIVRVRHFQRGHHIGGAFVDPATKPAEVSH